MSGEMNCEALRSAMGQGRELTAAEQAQMEECDSCRDAWLEATVTHALEAKPEVRIPADFAARIAANLPEKHVVLSQREPILEDGRARQWGLLTAAVLVAVGLMAAVAINPGMMKTNMGVIAMTIAAGEVAGIGLWLGLTSLGVRASRSRSRWS